MSLSSNLSNRIRTGSAALPRLAPLPPSIISHRIGIPSSASAWQSGPVIHAVAPLSLRRTTQPMSPSRSRSRVVKAEARYGGGALRGGGTPEISDRILGAIPYLLPFLNAFVYARFLYMTQPIVRTALQPVMPVIAGYNSIPFGSLIAFFVLYLGMINNNSLSRFVRFNAMQALLLDILLILPRLLESVLSPPSSGPLVQVYVYSQSFVWIFITAWVIYGIFSSFIGQYGRIPFIADAADQQIR